MAEQTDWERITETQAALHAQLGALISDRVRVAREILRVRSELHGLQRRADILAGKRKGGRPPGTRSATSLQGRVLAFMEENEAKVWTPKQVAGVLNEDGQRVGATLSSLKAYGHVQRVRRGHYQFRRGTRAPDVVPRTQQDREAVLRRVKEIIVASPGSPWSANRIVESEPTLAPASARHALNTLVSRGMLRRVRHGVYALAADGSVARRPKIKKRRRVLDLRAQSWLK